MDYPYSREGSLTSSHILERLKVCNFRISAQKMNMNATQMDSELAERNHIIEVTMRKAEIFARSIARKFSVPNHLIDDVISSAYLGLVEAAESFNAENGYDSFLSYAYLYVKGRVLREFRTLTGVSRAMLRWIKTEKEAVDQAIQTLNEVRSEVRSQESAKAVRVGLVMEYARNTLLNAALERTITPCGDIVSNDAKTPEEEASNRQINSTIEAAIGEVLNDEERLILDLRYKQDKTFAEIATVLNLQSRGTVSRRHQIIVDKIRLHLKNLDRESFGSL